MEMSYVYVALIGYLLGSIPSGVLMAKIFNLGNLREIGSGNIGATNVLRTGNKKAAVATLFFDAFKGFAAVFIAASLGAEMHKGIAFLFAILGHCFPIWLKFKGGKGVATFIGGVFALSWFIGCVVCMIWLASAVAFKRSSLAALIMVAVFALISSPVMGLLGKERSLLFSVIMFIVCVIIYFQHRTNIARLLSGSEPKIGSKA